MIPLWLQCTDPLPLEGRVAVGAVRPPPDRTLHSANLDSKGRKRLLSDQVQGVYAFDTRRTRFRSPDRSVFGYAANGLLHAFGIPDPSVTEVPFEATWVTEGGGPHRGDKAEFPDRIVVVVTAVEVAILDLDTWDLWMRFLLGNTDFTSLGPALGGAPFYVYDAAFADGTLALGTRKGLLLLDFVSDGTFMILPSGTYRFFNLGSRNSATFRQGGVKLSGSNLSLPGLVCRSVASLTFVQDYESDSYEPTLIVGQQGGASVVRLREFGTFAPRTTYQETAQAYENYVLRQGRTEVERVEGAPEVLDPIELPYVHALNTSGGAYLNWAAAGVRAGDYLEVNSTREVKILEVTETYLRVGWDFAFSGGAFRTKRPVLAATADGYLALATHVGGVVVLDRGWPNDIDSVSGPDTNPYPDVGVTEVRGIAMRGTDAYVATDVGVLRLQPGRAPTLDYGPAAPAAYTLLPGASCTALAFDPETRALAVAVEDGAETEIVYIDVTRQIAFKRERVAGDVRRLSFYRREV